MRSADLNSVNPPGEHLIEVVGLGVGAAADAFVRLADQRGFTVVAVSPNRFRLARVYRPAWATTLAICTAPAAGLGLLFLLVKRAEGGDAVIVEDRTGVKLRLTGEIPPTLVDAARIALKGSTATAPIAGSVAPQDPSPKSPITQQPTMAVPSFAPPPTPEAEATVHRRNLVDSLERGAVLVLSSGRTLQVGRGAVLGRAPSPDPQVPAAVLLAVDEPSLSKTHFTVGPLPHGVWIVDHHSTNGTSVVKGGQAIPCNPGVRAEVPFGSHLLAGELQIQVVAS